MNPMCKLTKEVKDCIVQNVKNGNYLSVAAQCAGIDRSTHNRWMNRGRVESDAGEDTEFSQYFKEIMQARAFAEADNVLVIRNASRDTWQAAAWWLERTFPDRWGRRDRMAVDHSGRDGGPIEVGMDLSKLTDKELEFLGKIVEKAEAKKVKEEIPE